VTKFKAHSGQWSSFRGTWQSSYQKCADPFEVTNLKADGTRLLFTKAAIPNYYT